ncbi:MAG: HEAT repeat domain-containing protein [Ignavibacteriae bacterium]|nr:HEAT repeat domain-containing protein [Ignavibacteria bacterium]MBI3364110.1 HEAT repeat domain-containing protein [Ignavibacteriota bacterium]
MRLLALTTFMILSLHFVSAQDAFSLSENGEAPSRSYDVLHYKLVISIDEQHKSIVGTTTITLVPIFPKLDTVILDASDMAIKSVALGSTRELHFETTSNKLVVHLDTTYSFNDTLRIVIAYSCTPKKGITFTGPDSGYPHKRWQVWSQGEDTTNHYWFPCYDFPNDKATSEIIATVRNNFTVLSNGTLVSMKENKKAGTKTFHWLESKPHASYLIMFAAGEYSVLRDAIGKLPLEFYVYPDDTLNARICFKQTADMIAFFNMKTGFTYPWEKYGQIILQDHFGGMENTSATTLADLATVYDERVRIDNSPTSLIAHELAHQWWGDVVTCKDWRHIWLNESFASYFDPLYHEYYRGRDEFDYTMYNSQQDGIRVDTARGRRPIVSVESYGENIYPRGAEVLHMLRFLLGDELFFRAIAHYITKFQFQPVETNDLKVAIEEATGQNLYWFFDQWVYKAGHPIFNLSYTWCGEEKSLLLSVRQVQAMDSLTGIFRMPVDVEVTSSNGTTTQRVNILSKDTTFAIPSNEQPRLVIFDKGSWLLKELKWTKTQEEWEYQAEFARNPIDRIRALQELVKLERNAQFVALFARVMVQDTFWALRREAITQSEKLDVNSDSLKALLKDALLIAAREAKRSAVRDAATGQLKRFRGDSTVISALQAALQDSSYNVMASAIRSLAKVDSTHVLPVLKQYLDYPSFRNRIHNAALNTLATIDSVQAIEIALGDAQYGHELTTRNAALGILRKHAKHNATIMALYQSLLVDKNEGIRSNAVRALGEIGEEATIAALEKIASDNDNSASDTAKESIEKIKKRIAEQTKQSAH